MKNDWYKDWFNTPEYLNVYSHRNETEAESLVNLILKNVKLPFTAEILDMASGAGRHSLNFARKGFNVTAVDLSENLLSVAKQDAEKENLKIEFLQADLRTFTINKQFDLAVNLFTSFGYFFNDEENFLIFQKAFEHLKLGGRFVFDYFNKNYLVKNLVGKSEDTLNGKKIIQERFFDNGRVVKQISIVSQEAEKNYHESVRVYDPEIITEALKSKGFEIVKKFGDFEGNDFHKEDSPRLIIIAKK